MLWVIEMGLVHKCADVRVRSSMVQDAKCCVGLHDVFI